MRYETLARASTKSVYKHTKRHWDEWVVLLTEAGAKNWTHKEIVLFLKTKFRLTPWWQQIVATGFETAIGKRVEGRNAKGEYSTTTTKSCRFGAKEAWKIVTSEDGIALWMRPLAPIRIKPHAQFETESGFFGEIRTLKVGQRIRLTWRDPDWNKPSVVQLGIVDREKDRSIIVFQHDQIPNARVRMQMKEYWVKALNDIVELQNARMTK